MKFIDVKKEGTEKEAWQFFLLCKRVFRCISFSQEKSKKKLAY